MFGNSSTYFSAQQSIELPNQPVKKRNSLPHASSLGELRQPSTRREAAVGRLSGHVSAESIVERPKQRINPQKCISSGKRSGGLRQPKASINSLGVIFGASFERVIIEVTNQPLWTLFASDKRSLERRSLAVGRETGFGLLFGHFSGHTIIEVPSQPTINRKRTSLPEESTPWEGPRVLESREVARSSSSGKRSGGFREPILRGN